MKISSTVIAAALLFGNTALAENYVLDPLHTEVRFAWNHLGLSKQHAEWNKFSGTVDFDPADIAATKVSVEIDPTSAHTGSEELDGALAGADFFDAENHPTITFESTSAVQTGADTMRLTGDLTVKGKATEVVLDVRLTFMGSEHPAAAFFDYYQGDWVAIEATGSVLRSEIGVGYSAPMVSDWVELGISAEMRAGGWPE